MILIIFKKIINQKKGGIEFVESSIIYPFMLFFMTLLILISILTIKRSIAFESSYIYSRNVLNDYKKAENNRIKDYSNKNEQEKLNHKLKKYDKNVSSNFSLGFFNNSININDDSSLYLRSIDFDQTKIINNIDFMKYVYKDLDLDEKFNIREVFSDLDNKRGDLMKKLIK